MKSQLRVLAVIVGVFCAATTFAQTAAPGTKVSVSTAPAAKSANAASPVKASAAPMAKASAPLAAKTVEPTTAVAGGGGGKVWVNSKSKTYHCEGTKFYGKTKVGEYMTEADAKSKGNHADHGKACAK